MTEEEFPKGKGQTELKRSKVGKVRYIFGGRCVIGPDIRLATVAFLLILVPSIIYNGWSLPWIVQRWNGAWLLVIFTVVIEAIVIALFMRTAMSDPGIVPREADLWGLDAPWLNQLMPKNPPKHQDIVIHGHLLKMKYCISCNFYRPPRCVHCSVCDNCVDKFDHHCPWVGNCVGRRNYRSFLLFVFSTSIYILTVMITSPIKFFQCLQEFNQDNDFRGAMKLVWPEAWDSVVLTLFSFGFLWFVLGLAGYHFYLISSNQTTYEQIKGFFEEKLNPWDRGLARNLTELLCRRRRPKFTFRPRVPVVYSRFQHIKIGMTGRIEEGGILKMKLPISTVDAKTGLPPTSIQEKIERIQVEHTIVHGADRDGDSISSHRSSSAELLSVMSAEDVVEAPFGSPYFTQEVIYGASRQDSINVASKGKAICMLCRCTSCNCLDKIEDRNLLRANRSQTEQFDVSPPSGQEETSFPHNQSFIEVDRSSSTRHSAFVAWLKRAGDLGRVMSKTELGKWTCVLPED